MSLVSQVFYTRAIVIIGLKNMHKSGNIHSIIYPQTQTWKTTHPRAPPMPHNCAPFYGLQLLLFLWLPFYVSGTPNVLVHYSAGVGRTGTFIALYRLMAKVDEGQASESIDIFNEVFKLREDRCSMVSYR